MERKGYGSKVEENMANLKFNKYYAFTDIIKIKTHELDFIYYYAFYNRCRWNIKNICSRKISFYRSKSTIELYFEIDFEIYFKINNTKNIEN